ATADVMNIIGGGASSGFKVQYFVGSQLFANGAFRARFPATGTAAPGVHSVVLKVVVTILSTAAHGAVKTVPVSAVSQGSSSAKDEVKARVSVTERRTSEFGPSHGW